MSLAVHQTSEIGKVALIAIGLVAFVVLALTWVPEMIAPSGDSAQEAPSVGKTVRMIQ
ncbi:hypothetical protein OGR47_18875 (plasmid) [Methylocystis sp. MJC1]|uniref:hypothetical protein n=1 Tax=Methylocystis sp. MJC1 TaxID=2654282 RepID=UPI0013ECE113|nr:hypothetical protein [Methylocystis sp. MJC1]KAF2989039.1 hypothetical protein MJC1_03895 [Methylocystis sp. MJC1]MBU6529022.1 hypothetical protein [Methylocystis sp. MJC1]UZX13967.1 hypothetical protein OGR47_18875 [Methylocystis sp. MJC1]